MWEDYRACVVSGIASTVASCSNETQDCFRNHLLMTFRPADHGLSSVEEAEAAAPWHRPSSCAVLLEFRPLEDQLRWSMDNALDNLPVSWCIQVAGSPTVLQLVNVSHPVEVAVGKIRLLDLGDGRNMTQVRLSARVLLCPHVVAGGS